MRDAHWSEGAYAAEFADERQFVGALVTLRDAGYSRIETYTPYHVSRIETSLPEPASSLPLLVFIAGVVGGAFGYWIQWFADAVSYPLNIGGRPAHAVPAFFIATFEATVLSAALAAFIGLFASLRLPRPWHPVFEVDGFERATVDHFWIAIDASDGRADAALTRRALEALEPVRVLSIPGER